VKAWRIVWDKEPDETGVWIAETKTEAVNKALDHLRDVGYQPMRTQIVCHRAPEYDEWAARQKEHRQQVGIIEEYVKREVANGGR
jgi:hypothetical protein